jgi:SAM-dependent methyltransferase
MDNKKIIKSNREAWNQATLVHQKARKNSLKDKFKEKGFSTLDEIATVKLNEISLKDKDVAQLCCNNGRELLSILNMGAKSGVGFDLSDEAVKEAHELTNIAGLKCEFVRTDVYDIGKKYHNRFDLIYISIGALYWLPDLNRFFGIVNKLLRLHGTLLIYEEHPFTYMLGTDSDEEFDPDDPTKLIFSYFRTEPWTDDTGIDYIGKTVYKSKPNYGFTQKFSDIINAIAGNGFIITELLEYRHDISNTFDHLKNNDIIPLCYTLQAVKM